MNGLYFVGGGLVVAALLAYLVGSDVARYIKMRRM